jgi:peptidoglycan/xylan/chitin deacetylase (PgdA/CDA1 family)
MAGKEDDCLRIPLVKKMRRTVRRVRRSLASRGLILLYHRVSEKDVDPWSLNVTPRNFSEHLMVLKRNAFPIRLDRLVDAHLDGKIQDRATVVTFDDGYANNLYEAKPILEHHDVPATVFVATGYIGHRREYWWDELDRALLRPGRLPERLDLVISGEHHRWDLAAAVDYGEEEHRRNSDMADGEPRPGTRISFYFSVWERLHPLPEREREMAMEKILAWANAGRAARQTHRPLDADEVRILEGGGLVEIGAHTVHHLSLSSHSPAVQREEIQGGKGELEEVLGHPVTSFSYPFGQFRKDTATLVRRAGFSCACTTEEEPVWNLNDRFQLPRFGVEDWSGEEFEKRLERWFNS